MLFYEFYIWFSYIYFIKFKLNWKYYLLIEGGVFFEPKKYKQLINILLKQFNKKKIIN